MERHIKDLSKVLKLNDENCEYISHTTHQLTKPGDNYGSIIVAVDVQVLNKKTNNKEVIKAVAKLCPDNEWIFQMFNIVVTFKKECGFYHEIIPTLQEFQREKNASLIDCVPKCFGSRISLDPASDVVDHDAVLLLENLKHSGFVTIDSLIGFNLEESEMIIKDLARFHAAPVAFKLQRPEEFKKIIMPHLTINMNMAGLSPRIQSMIFDTMETVVLASEETKHLVKKVREVLDHGLETYKNRTAPPEPFGTLVHNDYWVNNTMLKLNPEGKPLKNVMVDFQLIEYGSPATDIVFFLHSSVQKSVIKQHYDHLLNLYYITFIGVLKEMGVEDTTAFTMEELRKQLKFMGKSIEFFHTMMMLKPIFADRSKIKHATDFKEEDMVNMDDLDERYWKFMQDTVLEFNRLYWD